MASYKGREGVVKVGATVVGEVKSFELEVTANEIDATTMGSLWTKTNTSQKSWSGKLEMFYDPADTGQIAIVAGTEITVALYYQGTTTALKYDSGSAIVTSISKSQSFDGMISQSISFVGNGALTTAAAV